MKGTIASLLVVLCVTACSDASVTAPQRSISSIGTSSHEFGDPPPPPVGEIGTSSSFYGASVQSTYFFNPAGNNGWISFSQQQAAGVTVTSNARIEYHRGQVSGKGTISVDVPGGVVTINLANGLIDKRTIFNQSCSGGCASVGFNGMFTPTEGTPSSIDGTLRIGGEVPIGTHGQ